MNTRLPCIVRWVSENMDLLIKWLNWLHTGFKALRAGRTSNVQRRTSNNDVAALRNLISTIWEKVSTMRSI
jgi:hypothetical protein